MRCWEIKLKPHEDRSTGEQIAKEILVIGSDWQS